MVHIEKRKQIWDLFHVIDDFKSRHISDKGSFGRISQDNFLSELTEYGFKPDSRILHDIVALAIVENDQRVDLDLLFHVISQAVQKVLDRNLMFWNTIISVSSPTIAWIDFRRKLLKWLSNNGVGVVHSKNALIFVEKVLDKDGLGLVRKEDFLRFTEELMGIDCLLSEEGIRESSHSRRPLRRKHVVPISNPRSRHISSHVAPNSSHDYSFREPPDAFIESPHLVQAPVVPLRGFEEVADVVNTPSSPEKKELCLIRLRLGVGMLDRLVESRIRHLLGIIRSFQRSGSVDTVVIPSSVCNPEICTAGILKVALVVDRVLFRLTNNAFRKLSELESGSIELSTPDEPENESCMGPSWTVTMQAMAVATLHGILRNAITRALYPGLMSLRTGKTVDEIYAIRRVSYSQSKQGKLDAHAATLLDPIKENFPSANLEFDLST